MVYRYLKYNADIPDPEVRDMLSYDNLIERGYRREEIADLGFNIPEASKYNRMLIAGVAKGKEQYYKEKQNEARRR